MLGAWIARVWAVEHGTDASGQDTCALHDRNALGLARRMVTITAQASTRGHTDAARTSLQALAQLVPNGTQHEHMHSIQVFQ